MCGRDGFFKRDISGGTKKYSLRRSDRYTALVLAAAGKVLDAVPDVSGDTGVIVASSFGPHRTTCAFLDDLLDYREEDVMPTTFSHSVHNAAASYAASAFGLRGPEFTLTGFENLFYEALRTAELCGALCSRMLVVSVEENALMTEEIANHVRRDSAGRRRRVSGLSGRKRKRVDFSGGCAGTDAF